MRRPAWWSMVEASRDEACVAVEMYNRPGAPRSYETFVVHMHLAWLYLLQAIARRDGIDCRYIEMKGRRRRLVRVDGEPKTWELDRHIAERWPDPNDPVRANLRFFVALRNKIEHRYTRSQEALAIATGGHAHALLVNYETELAAQFGAAASLAHRLRFPVFVGSFTDDGEALLRRDAGVAAGATAALPDPISRRVGPAGAGRQPIRVPASPHPGRGGPGRGRPSHGVRATRGPRGRRAPRSGGAGCAGNGRRPRPHPAGVEPRTAQGHRRGASGGGPTSVQVQQPSSEGGVPAPERSARVATAAS